MSNAESAYGGAESAYGGASILNGKPGRGTGRNPTAARNPPTAARWARPLLIVITTLCGLVLFARFVAEPLTTIRHVSVHSDVPLTDDQVLLLSGIQGGEHWYNVSLSSIQRRLEASPLVRRAVVTKIFPDTILLTLWGRQPAALMLATAEGRSFPVLVDEDGVIFKVGTSSADLDLPVVSGLTAGDMALGAQLPQPYRALFSDLRAMREKAPGLCAAVSEVRVVGGGSTDSSPQDLELLVYLTSSPVPIRARGTLDESLVKYALVATDLLSRQGVLKDIQELDFRGEDVVYRLAGKNALGTKSAEYRDAKSAEYRDAVAGVKGG
ncbi:MAG: cell division protein FtsQ/DivIB [Spirochaetia bacterium]